MRNRNEWIKECRLLGHNRIRISEQAESRDEWERLWEPPKFDYSLKLVPWWKMTIEYKVFDFAAEIGFFIDILGFTISALSSKYAMLTNPTEDFHISIVEVEDESKTTPQDAFKIEFMVEDIDELQEELHNRGIVFEREPAPFGNHDSNFVLGTLRTPNNLQIGLWSAKDLAID